MAGLATETIAPSSRERQYFHAVFGWMAGALAVTGGVAAAIGASSGALHVLFGTHARAIVITSIVIELVLVAGLVGLVEHMGLWETAAVFVGYAALNGLTFSFLFELFTAKSIYSTFLVTAGMFGVLALWGYTTNADLTKWGSFLLMLLVGQVIGVAVNLFWLNERLYWTTTVTGVLIFSAYTAYDVRRLKEFEPPADAETALVEKDAIVGALALYLDFVNLFLYLIRILGRLRR